MTRNLALLAAGVLAAVLLVGISPIVGDVTVRTALGVLSGLGLIALYFADRRRQARQEKEAKKHAEERFRALQNAWRGTQLDIRIDAASPIAASLLMLLVGALFLLAGLSIPQWILATVGAVALLAAAVMLTGSIPAVGKPKLVLGRAGFSTPLSPLMPWQLVEGIDLTEVRGRDEQVVFHSLVFYIPSLPDHLRSFGLFHRLLYRLRRGLAKQSVNVVLRNPSEPAEAVLRIALQIWTEATGRTNALNVETMLDRGYPAHREAAAAVAGATTAPQFAALRRDTEAALEGADKQEALKDLAELEAGMRRTDIYLAARKIAARVRRRRARYGASACLLGALALFYFGADWMWVVFAALGGLLCGYVGFFENEALVPDGVFVASHPAANPAMSEAEVYRAYGRKPPGER